VRAGRLWPVRSASVAIIASIAGALIFAIASSAAPAPSADTAATDALLTADYAYEQAALADVQESRAALEGLASRIGSECPGVLKGAPPERSPGVSFARGVGESMREDEQLSELEGELGDAVDLTLEQSDRQALLAFVSATHALRWSNPTITQLVGMEDVELEEEVALPIPDVCADMKAWVSSGYKTLSVPTKELRAKREEADEKLRVSSTKPLSSLLAPYEGPAEKALIAKTKRLGNERRTVLIGLDNVFKQLGATLGIAHASEPTPTVSHPPAGAIVIGKGRTTAGGRYEVLLKPKEASRRRGQCGPSRPLSVQIVTTREGGISGCYSKSERVAPSVNCDEGLLTIQARTGPSVRSVRLRLSNGQQITSRVAIVPPKLGGPAGFYYQAVRGPTPIPVSLTELDAHGRPLHVLKLSRFVGCIKHLLKFLHNGIRTLVHGQVPEGPAFSIQGEAYRFLEHIHFALQVRITNGGGGGESPSGRKPKLFSWALWRGCEPHPYAILYGLLKQPGDTVLARMSGTLRPLPHVPIPAHLHAGGVLVYTA
jgi:hypothetical protein